MELSWKSKENLFMPGSLTKRAAVFFYGTKTEDKQTNFNDKLKTRMSLMVYMYKKLHFILTFETN